MGVFRRRVCLLFLCFSWLCYLSNGKRTVPAPARTSTSSRLPVRAVNLGGWLVTEGWILPSLFDAIPNNDLLDGTQLQFKSVAWNVYLAAEQGGGAAVVANRPQASGWETFKLWRISETTFNLKVFGGQFVGVGSDGAVVATAASPRQKETFKLVRSDADKYKMRIMAPSGFFLQARKDGTLTADYGESTSWANDDPSVFAVNRVTGLQGEYQICNGYGTTKARPILRKHWNTYIVEEDLKFIAASGLTAVRIPVGWWIASDPNPPAPYVGGSLRALDNAFKWAELHNLGVIIDLHAAPGSQNPWEHSSTRDGTQAWGDDSSIAQTVQVIDFLASRYARSSSLLAVELLNEPLATPLESLKRYYSDGYNAVRKHSPEAYVIMSNRLGIADADRTELVGFAGGFPRAVLDAHYYTLFNDAVFNGLTVQQNIDFVRTNYSSQLGAITTQNGPLTFVGEWVAEWKVPNAPKEDYQRFAKAQMEVYGQATFGWAYWTFKNINNHWSMEWMIKNGYISLTS